MGKKAIFKVLVADDDSDILELLVEEFTSMGCDIESAANGTEAINILRRTKIHLVVSDMRMPKGDGMSVLNFVNLMKDKPIFFFFSSQLEFSSNGDHQRRDVSQFAKPHHFLQLVSAVEKEYALFSKAIS